MQTGELTRDDTVLVPGKNLAVGRVKANFLSQSYVGALFTNGDPTGETSNQVGGIDLKLATSNFLKREKNLSLDALWIEKPHQRPRGTGHGLWRYSRLSQRPGKR